MARVAFTTKDGERVSFQARGGGTRKAKKVRRKRSKGTRRDAKLYETRGVLAGAYRGRDLEARELRTHYYDVTEGKWGKPRTLCGRIKEENLGDENEEQPATCPVCSERFGRAREKGKAILIVGSRSDQ